MQSSVLRFDEFELDLHSYELRKSGAVVKLEKLPTELLLLLARHQGELVTREQIIQHLWGDDVFVDTRQGINTAVRKIRLALHDNPDEPRMLQTVAGRGYRLLSPVVAGRETTEATTAQETPVPPVSPGSSRVAAPNRSRGVWRWILPGAIAAVLLAGAALWSAGRETAQPAVERPVTSNPPEAPVRAAVVSPDGKYVAYADPTGLYLREMANAETRPWPVPEDFEVWPTSWFPDSVHLLVTRFEGPGRVRSLWIVSLLGGEPRKIANDAAGGAVSPDGSQIAYLPGPDVGSALWVMDASGAHAHRIAVPESAAQMVSVRGSWITKVAWSPNGKRLAYLECHGTTAPDPAEDEFSLRIRDADGGNLRIVGTDARVANALWWAPDGRILYARQAPVGEQADQGVFSIHVNERTGQAVSQAALVTSGRGRIGGLSGTADGKQLVLWRVNTQFQVFITSFDAGTRRFRPPRRLTLDANGNVGEAWSSDSRAVFFVSNRNGTWKLFKQAIDHTTADLLVEGRSLFLPRLSADGSDILYLAASLPDDGSHAVSIMRRSLEGGPPQLVLQDKGIMNYQCARAPSRLCVMSKMVGTNVVFLTFDPHLGETGELMRMPVTFTYRNWTLSPDGRRLAIFLDTHHIRMFSLDAGGSRDIAVKDWPIFNGDWAADGQSLLLPSTAPDRKPVMLNVNDEGKAEVLLEGDVSTRFDWLLQSLDGRYGLLEEQVPGENNAWVIDRF